MAQADAPILGDVDAVTLDVSALDTLRELGDDAFVCELVDDFASSMDEYLPALRDATDTGDCGSACRIAHTIKSSSASMGAMRVSEIAARIEQAARGGALAGVPQASQVLEDETGEAIRLLREASAGGQ